MNVYNVEFEGVYPVGNGLVLVAETIEDAIRIAQKTIVHTDRFSIEKVDLDSEGVIIYLSGDY